MQSGIARGDAQGFTLIELMIVVAVVAILAAVAYPNYQDQVRKSRRGEAKAVMAEASQLLERFRTVNNTYVGAPNIPAQSPANAGTARYNLNVNATATTFTITAVPQGTQSADTCGTLTLTHTGQKGSGGSVDECW